MYEFLRKIIKEYIEDADKRIAFVGQFMVGFMLLIALLNFLGIFKISPLPLYATIAASIINFFLPTLCCSILKISSVEIGKIMISENILENQVN